MNTKIKPNLLAQFAEEPLEAEGFKWRNVYLHENHATVYGSLMFSSKTKALQNSLDTLSRLKKYGGGSYEVFDIINNTSIYNDCYLALQIPVKEG